MTGRVVVIGGTERRTEDGTAILRRFVELAGGPRARVLVATAPASPP